MTKFQLLLAAGLPTLAVLGGILINGMQFRRGMSELNARMTSLENRMQHLEDTMERLMLRLEERLRHC